MAIAIGAVIGVIVYRMAVLAALYLREEEILYKNASLVTTATAACINLAIIFVMNYVRVSVGVNEAVGEGCLEGRSDVSFARFCCHLCQNRTENRTQKSHDLIKNDVLFKRVLFRSRHCRGL